MRVTVLCLACAILAGCGSSPVEPTRIPFPSAPTFSTGQYTIQIIGFDFSSVPEIPACAGPIGIPTAGKAVIVELQVAKEGSEWVGRATAAGADLELRFRDSGERSFGKRAFSGTLRGRARDGGRPGFIDPRDVSVLIGAGSTVEGETAFVRNVSTLVGRALGDFQFADSAGNTASCSVVQIHINAPSN
jgi:hypothetical protein